MHARKSSSSIVLTSHSLSMGHLFVVLLLVFWAGVLLLCRFPASVTYAYFSSTSIRGDRLGLLVCTFGLGGLPGFSVCSFHMSLSGYTNSVVSCVSMFVGTLGGMA